MTTTRLYADGTFLEGSPGHAGGFVRGRALCHDGKVRAVRFPRGGHADTFFTVPAVVTYNRKTVTGFIVVQTKEGFDVPTAGDPAIVKFVGTGTNGGLIG